MHKVTCSICGRKDDIEVFRGKKIKNRNWVYFGKVMINSDKHDKYYYKVLTNAKGKFLYNKDGWFKTKKVENPNYVKTTIPKYVESWECKSCFDIAVKASS